MLNWHYITLETPCAAQVISIHFTKGGKHMLHNTFYVAKPAQPLEMSRTQFHFVLLLPQSLNPFYAVKYQPLVHHTLPPEDNKIPHRQARMAGTVSFSAGSLHCVFIQSKHNGTLVSHSRFSSNVNNATIISWHKVSLMESHSIFIIDYHMWVQK